MAEPLRATFFTLKHRDRAVLLPATIVFALILLVLIAIWAGINWRTFALVFEVFRDAPAQPDETRTASIITGMMALFLSTMLLLLPAYLAVAAYEAACLRWMIRAEAPGLFGLTLDHDTWRVYGVYWCWLVTNMAIGMVASVLMAPFMFMMMGDILAQGPAPDTAAMWNLQIRMQTISLLQYIPMIFLGVRLAPAAATSVARRRFSFLEAWTVTQDRFWPLLGSFAVLWLIAGAAVLAASSPVVVRMWPSAEAMMRAPSDENMQAYLDAFLSSETLVYVAGSYVVFGLVALALSLMSYGVNARAALAALEEGKITVAPQGA